MTDTRQQIHDMAREHGTDRVNRALDRSAALHRLAEALGSSPGLIFHDDRLASSLGIHWSEWAQAQQQIPELVDLELDDDPTVGDAIDRMVGAAPLARIGPAGYERRIDPEDIGSFDWPMAAIIAALVTIALVVWAS